MAVTPISWSASDGAVNYGSGLIDYFMSSDPVYYVVDNRPLRNLAYRDNLLKDALNDVIDILNKIDTLSSSQSYYVDPEIGTAGDPNTGVGTEINPSNSLETIIDYIISEKIANAKIIINTSSNIDVAGNKTFPSELESLSFIGLDSDKKTAQEKKVTFAGYLRLPDICSILFESLNLTFSSSSYLRPLTGTVGTLVVFRDCCILQQGSGGLFDTTVSGACEMKIWATNCDIDVNMFLRDLGNRFDTIAISIDNSTLKSTADGSSSFITGSIVDVYSTLQNTSFVIRDSDIYYGPNHPVGRQLANSPSLRDSGAPNAGTIEIVRCRMRYGEALLYGLDTYKIINSDVEGNIAISVPTHPMVWAGKWNTLEVLGNNHQYNQGQLINYGIRGGTDYSLINQTLSFNFNQPLSALAGIPLDLWKVDEPKRNDSGLGAGSIAAGSFLFRPKSLVRNASEFLSHGLTVSEYPASPMKWKSFVALSGDGYIWCYFGDEALVHTMLMWKLRVVMNIITYGEAPFPSNKFMFNLALEDPSSADVSELVFSDEKLFTEGTGAKIFEWDANDSEWLAPLKSYTPLTVPKRILFWINCYDGANFRLASVTLQGYVSSGRFS